MTDVYRFENDRFDYPLTDKPVAPVPPETAAEKALRLLKQLGAGVVAAPREMVFGTAAAASTALDAFGPRAISRALVPDSIPAVPPDPVKPHEPDLSAQTKWLEQQAAKGQELGAAVTGADEPRGAAERIARSGISAPFQALKESVDALGITPKGPPPETNVDSFASSGLTALGGEAVGGAVAPEAMHDPAADPQRYIVDAINAMPADHPDIPASRIVDAAVGPVHSNEDELTTLGLGAVISLGLGLLPGMKQKYRTGRPRLVPVEDAKPGTMGASTPWDLVRTQDDVGAGVNRMMQRLGVPPQLVTELKDIADTHTHASAMAHGDAAVKGEAIFGTQRFRVDHGLEELNKRNNPDVSRLLHLYNVVDELRIPDGLQISLNNVSNARARQVVMGRLAHIQRTQPNRMKRVIRGMDEQAALTEINQIERANPEYRDIRRAFKANMDEARRLAVSAGSMTRGEAIKDAILHPNKVPYPDNAAIRGEQVVDLGNPFAHGANHVRSVVKTAAEDVMKRRHMETMRVYAPTTVRMTDAKELKDNPHWRGNTVQWRASNGRVRMATTDPLVADYMRLDPYHIMNGAMGVMEHMRRFFEAGTTGMFAPWFATRSAVRSYRQAKINALAGEASPTILGSLRAIPEALLPQMAAATASSLNRGSFGWLQDLLGPTVVNNLSRHLTQAYENSLFHMAEVHGGASPAMLARQTEEATTRLRNYVEGHQMLHDVTTPYTGVQRVPDMSVIGKGILKSYLAIMDSIHGMSNRSTFKRNLAIGKTPEEAILTSRRMTGNPLVGGQWLGRSSRGGALDKAISFYGGVADTARRVVPWTNIIEQSMKSVGASYLKDPSRFMTRLWLYGVLPSSMLYFYNRGIGKDPQGNSYSEYAQRGRTGAATVGRDYIGIPGLPVDQGIEISRPQETSGVMNLATTAWDHLMRSSPYSEDLDWLNIAKNWAQITVVPSLPVNEALGIASTGMNPPMGAFGADTFSPQRETFVNDQTPISLDTMMRALAGGLGSVIGDAAMTYSHSEDDVTSALMQAVGSAGQSALKRTEIVGPLLGYTFPASSATQVGDTGFEDEKFIRDLTGFYKKWTQHQGVINTQAASIGGEAAVQQRMGDIGVIPETNAGVRASNPDNPLYAAFMAQMYKRYATDVKGDAPFQGFQTMLRRQGDITGKLKLLRGIDDVNHVGWDKEMAKDQAEVRYLEAHHVNWKSPRDVRSWYVHERQRVLGEINRYVKETEADMSKQVRIYKLIKTGAGDPSELPPALSEEVKGLATAIEMLGLNPTDLPDHIRLRDLSPYRHGARLGAFIPDPADETSQLVDRAN